LYRSFGYLTSGKYIMGYRWGLLLLGWFCSLSTWAASIWIEHTLPDTAVREYGTRYMVYLPDGYAEDDQKIWPVIVFLHGRSGAIPERRP
jgi:hypothetical protein